MDRTEYLRSAIVYLLVWAGVILIGRAAFSENAILESILDFRNGNWVPLLVVGASILLMALALKHMHGYFISKKGD